jgi:hypothetical protein
MWRCMSVLAAFGLSSLLLAAIPVLSPVAGQQEKKSGSPPAAAPPSPTTEEEKRREALQLLGQAELEVQQGRWEQALQLSERARQLFPESLAISAFIDSLKKKLPSAAGAPNPYLKAKAHLAAGISRAQELMRNRRYSEAVDLLQGVLEAVSLFPPEVDVSFYQQLAQKELDRYRDAVARGEIRPATGPGSGPTQPRPASPSELESPSPALELSAMPEGPRNAYRLVRLAQENVPRWYVQVKTALSRSMSVDYKDMPFGLVLDDVRRVTGLEMVVDEPVRVANIAGLALVDLRARNVKAETVLSLGCELAGCEYVLLPPQRVVITTKDKAGDYVRHLPESVSEAWARGRYLFPELYVEAAQIRPLPEVTPDQVPPEQKRDIPPYLRSGRDLVAHIQQLLR